VAATLGAGVPLECGIRELTGLARVLGVAPGKLRADDVLEDLVRNELGVGDALLDIEHRLEKSGAALSSAPRKWTVAEVVRALCTSG
jgi:hypothetical protein